MGRSVHITAKRAKEGMRGLEKLIEKDDLWQETLKALEEDESRLRDEWKAQRDGDDNGGA
jgi:hypothetical protein